MIKIEIKTKRYGFKVFFVIFALFATFAVKIAVGLSGQPTQVLA